jgi:hypothetical protein
LVFTSIVLVALAQQPAPAQDAPGSTPLTGLIVDAQGKPVGGAEVWLTGIGGFGAKTPVLSRARSEAEGQFRLSIPADKDGRRPREALTIWAYRTGSAVGSMSFERAKPPRPEATKLTLGTPAEARFRVVGPDGRPVVGTRISPFTARVEGLPYALPMPPDLSDRLAVRADAEGMGALTGMTAERLQHVRAALDQFGSQYVLFKTGEAGVATITLAPVGRVSGRVVADDPAAARSMVIHVRTLPASNTDPRSGEAEVTTGADGRFEIPAIAVGKLMFFGRRNGGDGPPRSLRPTDRSVVAGALTEVEIPLDGPTRKRTIAGVVRDREGRPVADAIVFQSGDGPTRTSATTDAQGRFQLPGVSEGKAFVFVKKGGFRFQGRPIDGSPGEVEVVLARSDEPPSVVLKTLPPPLPHDEELSLARRLIDPYLEKVLKAGDEAAKVRTLEALARAEPARTLELLEKKLFTDPFYNDMFRMRVVEGLAGESLEEALDVVESMEAPFTKALAYVQASDALPASDRSRKRDLLDRATLQARGTKEPQFRLAGLSQIADRLLDLGELERATKVLREGQAVAKELPNAAWAGYAKGAFAEELAQIDVPAALELTRDLSDPREFDRHHGNMAHELARINPAEAERIQGMIRDPYQRGYSATRVCYRMARVDLERARRIAATIQDPTKRAYAHGLMAWAIADSDRPAALGLIAEVFDALDKVAETGQATFGLDDAAVTAATLLPAVDAIDPKLLPDYFWRSLSLRRPDSAYETQEAKMKQTTATLSMRLARYDRQTARTILEQIAARIKGDINDASGGDAKTTLVAAAVIDPRWAVEMIETIPEPPDSKLQEPKNQARLAVVNMLTRRGERRWKFLQWHYMHLWVIDQEDVVGEF